MLARALVPDVICDAAIRPFPWAASRVRFGKRCNGCDALPTRAPAARHHIVVLRVYSVDASYCRKYVSPRFSSFLYLISAELGV